MDDLQRRRTRLVRTTRIKDLVRHVEPPKARSSPVMHTHTHTLRHAETRRDTQRHTETHRDTQRHTETHKDTQTQTDTDRDTHTQTETDTDTDRDRQTQTDTDRHRQSRPPDHHRVWVMIELSIPRCFSLEWDSLKRDQFSDVRVLQTGFVGKRDAPDLPDLPDLPQTWKATFLERFDGKRSASRPTSGARGDAAPCRSRIEGGARERGAKTCPDPGARRQVWKTIDLLGAAGHPPGPGGALDVKPMGPAA